MEIRLSGGQLRRVQTTSDKDAATTKQAAGAATEGGQLVKKATDRLSISKQAAEFLMEQSSLAREQAVRAAKENAEKENGMMDALQKAIKSMKQCAEIARRIRAGDKVPPEDEQFLMNNDPAGYKLAMAMRTPKKNPKEWESVLDDEEKDVGVQETSDSSESTGTAGTSASGGSAGGNAGGSQ